MFISTFIPAEARAIARLSVAELDGAAARIFPSPFNFWIIAEIVVVLPVPGGPIRRLIFSDSAKPTLSFWALSRTGPVRISESLLMILEFMSSNLVAKFTV